MRRVRFTLAALCVAVVAAGVPALPATAFPTDVGPGRDSQGSTTLPAPPKAPAPPTTPPAPAKRPAPGVNPALDRVDAAKRAVTEHIKARLHPTEAAQPRKAGTTSDGDRLKVSKLESSLQSATSCTPTGSEPWSASYSGGSLVITPLHNREGSARLTITNSGTQTWPAGQAWVGYRLFNDDTGVEVVSVHPQTPIPGAVSAGGQVTLDAVIERLDPGRWKIGWDVRVSNVGWFSQAGVCAYMVPYTLYNQQPSIRMLAPANYGTSLTRTPWLNASGTDVDEWPSPLTYQFRVCRDAALTQGCQESGWNSQGVFEVPWGYVDWNDTFYWAARVRDGLDTTPPSGWPTPHRVTVVVPVPDTWRTVGTGRGLSRVHGVVLPYGIWLHEESDADVLGSGPPLRVDRTYSTGAEATPGAFGPGWMSMFDAGATYSPDKTQLTITYPDGRQQVFGKRYDGVFVARGDSGSTNKVTVDVAGRITVKASDQEVLEFSPSGRLERVRRTGSGSLELTRDAVGQVTSVTQRPSGRTLALTWTNAQSPNCAQTSPPVISSIATALGTWSYNYLCGRLSTVCQPAPGPAQCTSYNLGTNTDQWFVQSPNGRQIKRPVFTNWTSDALLYSYRDISVETPDGLRTQIFLARPEPGQLEPYMNTFNTYGGITVQVEYNRQPNPYRREVYRYDELNRLRDLEQGGSINTPQELYPHRAWHYGEIDGHFLSFADENFHIYTMVYDADGNQTSKQQNRSTSEQVTTSSFYNAVPGGDPDVTRLTATFVEPNQGNTLRRHDMFSYDTEGRLLQRNGHPTPNTVDGQVTTHAYTAGTETAVGARRGGTAGPSPEKMPAGLLRSTTVGTTTTLFSYNANGDLTQVTEPGGRKISYDYDVVGRRTSETTWTSSLAEGTTTSFVVDALGRTVEEIHPQVTNEVTGVSSRKRICRYYDNDGLTKKAVETGAAACPAVTAPRAVGNRTTEYTYDNAARVLTIVDTSGATTTFSYRWRTEPLDHEYVEKMTEPTGKVTERHYDSGRLTEVKQTVGVTPRLASIRTYVYDAAGRKVEDRDALGGRTFYEYTNDDLVKLAVRLDVPRSNGSPRDVELFRRQFDGAGRVISETTADSSTVNSFYDAEGKIKRTVRQPGTPLALATNYLYDPQDRLVSRQSVFGTRVEAVRYTRDAAGAVTSETVENGSTDLVTRYERDGLGRVVKELDPRAEGASDPDAFATTSRYDAYGRVVSSKAPPVTEELAGQSPTTVRPEVVRGYNVFGELTHVKDEHGRISETVYDDAGRVTEEREPTYTPPGGSPITPTTRYTYGANGRLYQVEDSRGQAWAYGYDAAGNVNYEQLPETDAGFAITRRVFDELGRVTEQTDPAGAKVYYYWDTLDRKTHEIVETRQFDGGANYHTTTFDYDNAGNVTAVVNPAGARTTYTYTADNQRASATRPGVGASTRWRYDAWGRLAATADTGNRVTEMEYDLAGRATLVRHRASPSGPQLDVATAEYDVTGNTVAVVNANGHRSTQTYDAMNRLVSATQPVSATESVTASAGYDRAGNRTRTTDGRGDATWTTYNSLGRAETVTEPSTAAHPAVSDRRWTFGYDGAGNLVKTVKPGGVVVDRYLDAVGRLTDERSGSGSTLVTRYLNYDIAGRLVAMSHPNGLQTFAYSDRGLMTSSSGPGSGSSFEYDAAGRMTKRVDAAGTSTFTWRPSGDLATMNDSATGLTRTYNYDATTGELKYLNNANGSWQAWEYDNRGRVSKYGAVNSGNIVMYQALYGYDGNGNLTGKDVTVGPQSGGTYGYDKADRLSTWTPEDGTAEHRYTWDAAGNRTAESTVVSGQTPVQVGSWAYDARTRLTASTEAGISKTYAYTPRGTLASTTTAGAGTSTTAFDAFDRMTADGAITYRYDSMDRVATRDTAGFLYAGAEKEPVVGPGELYNRDPFGALASARLAGINATPMWPITDPRGDVVGWQRTDQTPQAPAPVAGQTTFDPFGVRRSSTGSQSKLGYQGDWTDPTTGTVSMQARWFRPGSAGFLSRDDVDLPFGATSMNRYGYAAGNPLTNTDPSGHWCNPPAQASLGLSVAGPPGAMVGASAGVGGCVGGVFGPGGVVAGELVGAAAAVALIGAVALGGTIFPDRYPYEANGHSWQGYDAMKRDYYSLGCVEGVGCGQYFWCGCPKPLPQPKPPSPPRAPRAKVEPEKPRIIHTSSSTLTLMWSTEDVQSVSGYRVTRVDNYLEQWTKRTAIWNTGAVWTSGWYRSLRLHESWTWRVKTVDPTREDAPEQEGEQDPDAGDYTGEEEEDQDDDQLTACGIGGNLLSCLAETATTPVGGGCAAVRGDLQECAVEEPNPGTAVGTGEAHPARPHVQEDCDDADDQADACLGKRWKPGQDIYRKTAAGKEPAWSTVRARFWKNLAADPVRSADWTAADLERMRLGKPPVRYNAKKGGTELMELSHEPIPMRDGGRDVVPRWPQDHARVDPFRRPGY
ncbi:RHS repeat-associated core domain-containing protein [Actinokineospora diospyrosa]|uniref:RHS repeat-associated core domain-containing protein n=1 Tax=Actinokineospora diospyrosa TaxID=103728 RepID=A0ABT1IDY9_9PSEU|nr:RHS repeat-associated core domain-containing protein [Actinokineospora diospyrosa]MCP2270853.1 RHS repeat-associated core domain-containing protein [Actinokineospora diospyrosa]